MQCLLLIEAKCRIKLCDAFCECHGHHSQPRRLCHHVGHGCHASSEHAQTKKKKRSSIIRLVQVYYPDTMGVCATCGHGFPESTPSPAHPGTRHSGLAFGIRESGSFPARFEIAFKIAVNLVGRCRCWYVLACKYKANPSRQPALPACVDMPQSLFCFVLGLGCRDCHWA